MADHPPLKFAAIGLDHRHIYHQVGRLLEQGAVCKGFHSRDDAMPLEGFVQRFPDLRRVIDPRTLLEDPEVQLIVTAGIPAERAEIAIQAMRHGKDVMVDKPGVITAGQLAEVRKVQSETGRIWSVDFSERFEVRAMTRATELVRAGALGRVVQTIGLGPHRLNRHLRPAWFFEPARAGGILADIGSHQIDQFLHFTGSNDAEIALSAVANCANPQNPEFEDFGEILLRSEQASGYIRIDWYTPDGLPTWGDGRCTILGTEGYIELRKYVDIAGREGTDHLFLVDNRDTRHVDCRDAPLPYYERLIADVFERTETAMPQAHCFKVCELALEAQTKAKRLA
jgi:predicted dehydrogenase